MAPLDTRQIEEARKTLRDHYSKSHQIDSYPEEWRNLSELPSKEEIMPKTEADQFVEAPPYRTAPEQWNDYQSDQLYDPSLPFNVIDGPWESKMAYVGSHYQLLREDAVAALRRSVGEVQANPHMLDDNDTCIYTYVTFIGLQICRIGAGFRIAFSTERASKQIRWKQSKRLLQGTLVALSPHRDRFRSICKLAVIAARPFENGLDQNPPTVDLFWADPNEAVFDPVEKYMMVEAREGYFEASRHMLVALQKLMTEKSELMKHVAFLDREGGPPRYLEKQPFLDLTALEHKPEPESTAPVDHQTEDLFNVDVINNFPRTLRSTMDDSQLQACRDMLTKSVAIVQGPPGTGKTFTSVSALKVMIGNLGPDDPPIIISAQTNHALDQLLNHVMDFEQRVVRLGGRADKENNKILERTLYELRIANPSVPHGKQGLFRCLKDHQDIVAQLKTTLGPILRDGIITAEALLENDLITSEQRASLFEADAEWEEDEVASSGLISEWIGDGLEAIPGAPPINLGLPLEEEDIAYEQAQTLAMELDGNENRDGDSPPQDSELDALGGEWVPFLRKFTGKLRGPVSEGKVRKLLKSNPNLNLIDKRDRGEVYRHWEMKLNNIMRRELRSRLVAYQKTVEEYQVTRGISNLRLVRYLGIKVVGCTTTGLAKYRGFVSALRPRTLLIEEAAETLEGTIMSGLFESLEQLILVGDHQQLQAQCTVRALEDAPYHLKVSMFERLIDNGLPYVMLNRQRRMIPDIRKLLCIEPDPFYKNLKDHESVLDRVNARPPVPGMGGRDTYFFHHTWPEARSSDSSRYNPDEAEMMAGFYHYLVYNGVDPSKITVLTFYNGQRRHLIKELKKKKDLYGQRPYFKVFTVDSYQGEENDIILLSLVRSNSYLSVGFLDNRNRLVVALSRARRGLYVFGNTITLTMTESTDDKYGREPLWDPLIQHMKSHGRYNLEGGLPITCKNHGNTVRILDPISWFMNTGGCEMPCSDGCLQCGHACPLPCHPFEHSRVFCKQPCERVLACGHGCADFCSVKPCHCTSCGLAEGADGRMFDPSTDTNTDLKKDRLLLEHQEEEVNYDIVSPRNEVLKVAKSRGRHRNRITPSANDGRGGSRFDKEPARQSGKQVWDSDSSPSPPKADDRFSDTRPLKPIQDGHKTQGMPLSSHEGSTAKPSFRYRLPSNGKDQNRSPYTPSPRNTRSRNPASNPRAWRSWDAKKADEAMDERRKLEDELSPAVSRSNLVFNETYLPVTVENGLRRRDSLGVRKSVISRAAPSVVAAAAPTTPAVSRSMAVDRSTKTPLKIDTSLALIDLDEAATTNSKFSKTSSATLTASTTAAHDPSSSGFHSLLDDGPTTLEGLDTLESSLLDLDNDFFVYDHQYSDLSGLDVETRQQFGDNDFEEMSAVKPKKQTPPFSFRRTEGQSNTEKVATEIPNLLDLFSNEEDDFGVKTLEAISDPSPPSPAPLAAASDLIDFGQGS